MKELYKGHGWRLTLETAAMPDGREKTIGRGERADVVSMLAFTQEGKILLLREYRAFYQDYIWMLPSGRVDKENDADAAAQRELQEETGFRADSMEKLWTAQYAEALKATNHFYLAKDLHHDPLPQDAHETIEVHECTLDEAIEKVLGSSHVHMASAYAILRFEREYVSKKKTL